MKKTANNAMYSVQEPHNFYKHSPELHSMKLHPKSHYKAFYFHQYFHYILQLIYQLTFFYTYNFDNLNILQHHTIYHTHTHNLLGFQINPLPHIPLAINSLHSHLHLPSFHLCLLLQTLASNLHLHAQVLCHSICLVSLVLDIRLNTLTVMFLIVSGTHNLAYGSLIVLQLPLHLFIVML